MPRAKGFSSKLKVDKKTIEFEELISDLERRSGFKMMFLPSNQSKVLESIAAAIFEGSLADTKQSNFSVHIEENDGGLSIDIIDKSKTPKMPA